MDTRSFPLSLTQQDILLDQLWHADSPLYNVGGFIRLPKIDVDKISSAHEKLVCSHDPFGLRILTSEGEFRQYVTFERTTDLKFIDFSSNESARKLADDYVTQLFETPFNIEESELFRSQLLKICEDEFWYVGLAHHLVMDGWGFCNWASELNRLYDSMSASADVTVPWEEVVEEDQKYSQSRQFEKHRKYWQEHCDRDTLEVFSHRRTSAKQPRSGREVVPIDKALYNELRTISKDANINVSHLFLGAFAAYLGLCNDRAGITLSLPFHNRKKAIYKKMLGVFTSISPINIEVDRTHTFSHFIKNISNTQRQNLRAQRFPLSQIFSDLNENKEHQTNFDISFNYLKLDANLLFDDHPAEIVFRPHNHESTPLMLTVWEYGDNASLEFHLDYNLSFFQKEEVLAIAQRLLYLLENIKGLLDLPLSKLPLVTEEERKALLPHVSRPGTPYSILDLFAQESQKCRNKVAISNYGRTISYEELDQASDDLAIQLSRSLIRKSGLIGIATTRNIDMVILILATLKAGYAYVPMDPAYPTDRLNYIAKDAELDCIITDTHTKERFSEVSGLTLDIAELRANETPNDPAGLPVVKLSDLAYVIYTSGSTGNAKGVAIEHRALASFLSWGHEFFEPEELSQTLASTSLNFDLSVLEIFLPLATGNEIVLVDNGLSLIEKPQSVTFINAVPTVVRTLLDNDAIPNSIKLITSGGEALSKELLNTAFEKTNVRRFCNMYGPTEDTVYSSTATFYGPSDSTPSIGRINRGSFGLVLSGEGQLLPPGSVGELYLGGAGLARGYLNKPELTAERFVANPYGEGRLYRTGDLVRWLPDGELAYTGRNDHQIKLRGFRIELGEIESHLQSVAGVNDAVVQVHDAGAQPRLVAYVVSEEPEAALSEKLSGHLRSSLPEYMVPGQYVVLSALPQLPNGKVDRKQLVPPSLSEETTYRAPQTETERQLCEVWSEVLKVERVGTEDNFFGLGGDSILSIQVVSRCRQLGLRVSVRQLFEHQTVRRLSQVVSALDAGTEAEQGEVTGEQVLLPVQRQFFEQTLSQPNHYNQSVLLKTPPGFTVEALQAIVQGWYARHDSLHVRFVPEGQSFRGVYTRLGEEQVRTGIQYYDMRAVPLSARASRQLALCEAAQASLDIGQGELFRAVYFEYEEEGRLLLVLHHLIVDGISWRILLPELELAWQQLSSGAPVVFAQKSSSYQQFGQALQAYSQSEALHQELAYWVSQAPQPVVLPSGDAGSGRAQVSLDEEQTRALLGRCNEAYRTQINELLLSALLRGYQRWSGESGLSLHMEGHGREELFSELDISETLGWFTSMYPLRLTASPEDDTGTLIQEVKEQCRAIPNNGIGYGVLRYLSQAEGLQAQGVGEVEFNYLGQFDNTLDASSAFALSDEPMGASVSGENVSPVRLSVNGLVNQGCLQFTLEAKTPDVALAGFAEAFQAALLECVNHCDGHRGGFTPGDFPYATLDGARIKALEARYPSLSKVYMATGMQSGMLFHDLLAEEGTVYNSQIYCDLDGTLDVARLEQAWNHVISRHDILRTAFDGFEQEQLHQVVSEQVSLRIAYYDWRDADDVTARIAEYQQQDKHQAFDFAQAPLMRVSVIRMTSSRYHLVWTHHHALLDGWCTPVVFAEVMRLYEADNDLAEAGLPAVQDYEQYIGWLLSQDEEAARAYWREALSGFDSVNTLSLPVPQAPRSGVGMINTGLSVRDSEALSRLAREHHVTVNVILQAAWGYVLSCYSGQRDVVYGATVSGRPSELPGVDTMMGLFINTLPVRMQLSAEQTVGEVLSSLQQGHVQRDEFSYLPLSEIQRVSESGAGAALFDTLLVFENYPMDEMVAGVNRAEALGLTVSGTGSNNLSNYGLSLTAHMSEGQLSCELVYQQSRYEQSSIEQLWRHLSRVLQQIAQGGLSQQMRDLQLLDEQEQQALLNLHGECKDIPVHRCLHELFESQAAASPDATAVICEGEHLSYGELNRRANQLAHRLRQQGVTGDSLVGLCTHRSFEMLTGMLGILKAGGAYVPLDPAYPAARLNYMIKDAGLSLIVTEPGVTLPALETPLSLLQIADEALQDCPDDNLTAEDVTPHNLAYIIYTSGSTGQPKGVMIEHRAAVNYVNYASCNYLDGVDGCVLSLPLVFDASVTSIWTALCNALPIEMVTENEHAFYQISDFLQDDEEKLLFKLTPAHLEALTNVVTNRSEAQHTVIVGGEQLTSATVNKWCSSVLPNGTLINEYGPTETVVGCSVHKVDRLRQYSHAIPVGKGIWNTTLYVFDEDLNMVPDYVTGELYIGGHGLARGYLNKPDLTKEKFCSHPLDSSQTLYKTGDRVFVDSNGELNFVDRFDRQVKVRGYRIELEEIEQVLNSLEEVQQCSVLIRDDSICAALVLNAGGQDSHVQCISDSVERLLPEYMCPQSYVVVDSMPLTKNGKLDKRKLSDLVVARSTGAKLSLPQNSHQRILCQIWQSVLNQTEVGIDDNFFELGGHSLLATRALSEIREQLSLEIPLKMLFEYPTVKEFAAQLTQQHIKAALPDIGVIPRDEKLPLSYAQQRLWFIDQLEGQSPQYNMPASVTLQGEFNRDAFERTIGTLIERHEVLRTTFKLAEGEPYQDIAKEVSLPIDYTDLRQLAAEEQEKCIAQMSRADAETPFDLSHDVLLRVHILACNDKRHVVLFNMHHIASDGWSMGILIREFNRLYDAFSQGQDNPLEPLPVQYADYASWQRNWLQGEVLSEQLSYWKEQLSGLPQVHNLPLDKPRPVYQQFEAASHDYVLPATLRERIYQVCQEQDVTLFMFLQTVFSVLLSRYSNEKDIVIGAPIAGRVHKDTESLIGFFVNSLVLRTSLEDNPSFEALLQRNKQMILDAYDHQHVPFEMLVDELQPERSLAYSPLFQVTLTLNNHSSETLTLSEGVDAEVVVDKEIAKFDMELSVNETCEKMSFTLRYNSLIFDASSIQRMLNNYAVLIEGALSAVASPVARLPLLSSEEYQLQSDWTHSTRHYPTGECLHEVFETQAALHGSSLAVRCAESSLSYDELNARSNQLARSLLASGAQSETRVGLCVERSVEMMVGLLGILKAGCAYVPLEPGHPTERLRYQLSDAELSLIVSHRGLAQRLPLSEQQVVLLDDGHLSRFEDSNLPRSLTQVSASSLAYVIYTSGSTGHPKGTLVEHASLMNFLYFAEEAFMRPSVAGSVVSSPIAFDATVQSLYVPLLSGRYVEFLEEDALPIESLADYLFDDEDELLFKITPSHLKAVEESGLIKRNEAVRHVLVVAGEQLDWGLLRRWQDYLPNASFINEYGPTEATVGSTTCAVSTLSETDETGGVPIGRPIGNARCYVLDTLGQPVPVGVPGELYIGGAGVCRGYLNQAALTSEKFVHLPDIDAGRLYRTGDRVRWTPAGQVSFIGRMDNQVKLRGFRVELGEIESSLERHEGIEKAVVNVHEGQLVGYILADKSHAGPVRGLAEQEAAGAQVKTMRLDNGMVVGCLNEGETRYTYEEIFEQEAYLSCGIELGANATVLDVGANTGMFSLFLGQRCPDVRLYSFEPIPSVFDVLSFNTRLYGLNAHLIAKGVSDQTGEVEFTYYPHNSLISSRYGDQEQEIEDVKRYLRIEHRAALASGELTEEGLDELLRARLESEQVRCEITTLSDVIAEQHLSHIDLLKIDVQKSEMDVLQGLRASDWRIIQQVIIEVHDIDDRVDVLCARLAKEGFNCRVMSPGNGETGPHKMVYGVRPDYQVVDQLREKGLKYGWNDGQLLVKDAQEQLRRHLASYMVPERYVMMAALPLNANGKVDRKALPDPDKVITDQHQYVAPRTKQEQILCDLWAEVLKLDRVGIDDNFFELGGHSLLATRALSEIREQLSLEIPLKMLFEYPTVKEFAAQLTQQHIKAALPDIGVMPRDEKLPLSYAQQRLWFIDQLEGQSPQYNMPASVTLQGEFNRDAFERTIGTLIERHEVLRTTFKLAEGEPYQDIAKEVSLPIDYTDLRQLAAEEQEKCIAQMSRADAETPFDLSHDVLLRVHILACNDKRHVVLFNMHHIASDGWSMGILIREFNRLYDAFSQGQDNPLEPLPVQYADYASWQRNWLQGEVLSEQLSYWKEQLSGLPQVHNLPLDKPRPVYQQFEAASHDYVLPATLRERIYQVCQEQDVTLFMFLQTVFSVLLSRYSNEKDIVIGAPIAGRVHKDTESLIGFFVNSLVLRTSLEDNPSFEALLQRNKQMILDAYDHQHVPFEMLVDELQPERSLAYSPLFQVTFSVQNERAESISLGNSKTILMKNEKAHFDIDLTVSDEKGCLNCNWVYNDSLFNSETISRMSKVFGLLLKQLTDNLDKVVTSIDCLDDMSRQSYELWNSIGAAIAPAESFHEHFMAQVQRTPGHLAVSHLDQGLSYQELDALSDKWAGYLQSIETGPGKRVGLLMSRGMPLAVGLLSVLKSGASFVLIDPDYPVSRQMYMLSDSGAQVLLTESRYSERAAELSEQVIELSLSDAPEASLEPVSIGAASESCVFYTSGSTGQPKGSVYSHGNLINYAYGMSSRMKCHAGDRVLQLASVSFDVVLEELLPAWLSGATVVVRAGEGLDISELDSELRSERINYVELSYSQWREWLYWLSLSSLRPAESLKSVLVGCDAIPGELMAKWSSYGIRLLHVYGLTEATVTTTVWDSDEWQGERHGMMPMGRPLLNTQCYVLNESGQLQPVGVGGELYIGGAGVTSGYLNRPELTASRFVPNPFGPGVLYRTGDQVRWRADGQLVFMGRQDSQVKIRGYRIELGEVESQLASLPGVRESVVVVQEQGTGDKRLVGYVVPQGAVSEDESWLSDIRAELQTRLPGYMVPGLLMPISGLPLTANGKVDVKALPSPVLSYEDTTRYEAPQSETEQVLCDIWQQALGVERVGVTDNFFEIGGHSLLATRISSDIRNTVSCEISIRDIFEAPTVRQLAKKVLGESTINSLPPLNAIEGCEDVPASFAQQRLWLIDQIGNGSEQYNMPSLHRIKEKVSRPVLQQALNLLLDRHEVLRTNFYEKDGQLFQHVCRSQTITIDEIDISSVDKHLREEKLRLTALEHINTRFDLGEDLLLKASLIKLHETEYVLIFNMHHIATDGWSMQILEREFKALYQSLKMGITPQLANLPIQYTDYAYWQRELINSGCFESAMEYWKTQLTGCPEIHRLPTKNGRTAVQSYSAQVSESFVSKAVMTEVKTLCKRHNLTLFMLMETVFAVTLGRLTNADDVIVGTPISGRIHKNTEALIGCFVNTLALRTRFDRNDNFADIVKRNSAVIMDAFEFQYAPFEAVVDTINPKRSLAYNPLVQIMFHVESQLDEGKSNNELPIEAITLPQEIIRFDLEFHATETHEGLNIRWKYADKLFDEQIVLSLQRSFETILHAVIDNFESEVLSLPLAQESTITHCYNVVGANKSCNAVATLNRLSKLNGNDIAVKSSTGSINYQSLINRANALALYWESVGVAAGDRIAIVMERSPDLLAGIIAALKLGAIYVPLDPKTPSSRVKYILSDADVKCILTDEQASHQLPTTDHNVLVMDSEFGQQVLSLFASRIFEERAIPAQNVAYIIYTSGSTGQPKGVCVTHANLEHYLGFAVSQYRECADESGRINTVMSTSVAFDATVTSIFLPLLTGGCVEMLSDDSTAYDELSELILSSESRLFKLTPSHLTLLEMIVASRNKDEQSSHANHVFVIGGEQLLTSSLKSWQIWLPNSVFINEYGPTETTVGCTIFKVDKDTDLNSLGTNVPIGNPIEATRLRLLDEHGNHVPKGVPAELFIGGRGVSAGYLNKAELSESSFLTIDGERYYRSGDLVRTLPDGNLEYIGRLDDQLKLRGHRIEPGEIESQLLTVDCVSGAAAAIKGKGKHQVLVAYIVLECLDEDKQQEVISDCRNHLSATVVDYMLPGQYMVISEIPLTSNGKLDRDALPEPEKGSFLKPFVPPATKLQRQLLEQFEQLLELSSISILDDFFDIGGNSLLATQFVAWVKRNVTSAFTVREFFEFPSVKALSEHLSQSEIETVFEEAIPTSDIEFEEGEV